MTRTTGAIAAGLAALALTVSACGDDDPESGADPTTSASAEPTADETSEATTEATPTDAESSAGVAPATGLALEEETSAINVPEGWTSSEALVDWASAAMGPTRYDSIQLSDRPSISPDATLDEQAESLLETLPKTATGERLPDVDLGGTTFFMLRYTDKSRPTVNWNIGTIRNGHTVAVDVSLDNGTLAAEPMLLESVLASFRFLD